MPSHTASTHQYRKFTKFVQDHKMSDNEAEETDDEAEETDDEAEETDDEAEETDDEAEETDDEGSLTVHEDIDTETMSEADTGTLRSPQTQRSSRTGKKRNRQSDEWEDTMGVGSQRLRKSVNTRG